VNRAGSVQSGCRPPCHRKPRHGEDAPPKAPVLFQNSSVGLDVPFYPQWLCRPLYADGPRRPRSFPTAACFVLVSECKYRAVLWISECPSSSCTVLMSVPLRMRWVAKVWRSVCGVMPLPFSPAFATTCSGHTAVRPAAFCGGIAPCASGPAVALNLSSAQMERSHRSQGPHALPSRLTA